jgi:hypothetical protein
MFYIIYVRKKEICITDMKLLGKLKLILTIRQHTINNLNRYSEKVRLPECYDTKFDAAGSKKLHAHDLYLFEQDKEEMSSKTICPPQHD